MDDQRREPDEGDVDFLWREVRREYPEGALPRGVRDVLFAKIYRAKVRWLMGFFGALGADGELREQCTTDTFVTAWKQMDAWQPDGAAKYQTFLRAIAVNHWRNAARKRRRRARESVTEESALEKMVPAVNGEAIAEGKVTFALVLGLLSMLSDGEREAWVLVRLEEVSMRDAAEWLACPEGTVFSRVRAAQVKLDRYLNGDRREREGGAKTVWAMITVEQLQESLRDGPELDQDFIDGLFERVREVIEQPEVPESTRENEGGFEPAGGPRVRPRLTGWLPHAVNTAVSLGLGAVIYAQVGPTKRETVQKVQTVRAVTTVADASVVNPQEARARGAFVEESAVRVRQEPHADAGRAQRVIAVSRHANTTVRRSVGAVAVAQDTVDEGAHTDAGVAMESVVSVGSGLRNTAVRALGAGRYESVLQAVREHAVRVPRERDDELWVYLEAAALWGLDRTVEARVRRRDLARINPRSVFLERLDAMMRANRT